jgi:fructosamine-3-kinase
VNALPAPLARRLEAEIGARVTGAQALGGGMINHAARVETSSGRLFVKWNAAAPRGMFAAEAEGLRLLHASGALRVPSVIALADKPAGEAPAFLALEMIETAALRDPSRFAIRFGAGLAAQHTMRSQGGEHGLDAPNFIGSLPQHNDWRRRWSDFYRDCRILPQIDIARAKRLLPAARERALQRVLDQLDTLLDGPNEGPVLLHGDLWSGNLLCAEDDTPVVIDPAVFYGCREVEIAFVELFGGFPAGWRRAYEAKLPLDVSYERRKRLLQLYPLLVHLNHFGESYGPDVDAVCREYRA